MLLGRRARVRRPVASRALESVPAKVGAAGAVDGLVVDLLPAVLTDVGDHNPVAVERESPRVAQPTRVDLVRALAAHERVRARDAVPGATLARRGIDAEQLSEQASPALRVLARVARAAAVAGTEVELPVGAELELAAVVVRERAVANLDHLAPRARLRELRVVRAAPVFLDPD